MLCDTANRWEQFGSNCYKLHYTLRKSWMSARSECLKEGADLVSISSAEEEQYVLGLDPSHYDLWLGYSTLVRLLPEIPYLYSSHSSGFNMRSCSCRNATRFPVKFSRTARASVGLMQLPSATRTGLHSSLISSKAPLNYKKYIKYKKCVCVLFIWIENKHITLKGSI